MMRTVLAVAALALGVAAANAQDPIAARKALMKENGQHSATLAKMIRGEEPFDGTKVQAAFVQFADTARKLPEMFPENSKTGDTRALLTIWDKRAEFAAAVAKFAKDVDDNRGHATSLDGLKSAMTSVGRNCGSCHEAFRRPQS